MPSSILTTKGQVTVPKEVRQALGLRTGARLIFVPTPAGYLLKAATHDLMRLEGSVPYDGPALSVEDMHAAAAEAAVEAYRS